MSSEGQSPVVAGLALCAASAGPRICVLLPDWSHTVETQRSRTELTAVTHLLGFNYFDLTVFMLVFTDKNDTCENTSRSFERHHVTPGSAARHNRGCYWQRAARLCGRHSGISFDGYSPSPACTCACISPGGTSKALVAAFSARNRCRLPTYLENN